MQHDSKFKQKHNHTLRFCKGSFNCASTLKTNGNRNVKPMKFYGNSKAAQKTLLRILKSLPRTTILTLDGNYIHALFVSRLFRFIDDVEFFVDETTKTIQMRSASRVGRYDFRANRKRLIMIRKLYEERIKSEKPN